MMPRIVLTILILTAIALPDAALEVFINTNSPPKGGQANELFDRDDWKHAAQAIDGIWYVGQGMSKPPGGGDAGKARDKWIESLKDKKWIVEMKEESASAMAGRKPRTVHEVKAMKEAGIRHFSAMVWTQKHNKDSTITLSEAADVREGLKAAGADDAKLIANTRAFHRNDLLKELVKKDKIDGFSVEIPSHGVRQGQILEHEVGAAIQFAVKQRKDVYVLINAEHSGQFLEDVRDIFHRLSRSVGRDMKSDHVKVVLSAYSGGKTHFTPERHKDDPANTVTGAAAWLCAEADRLGLRSDK